MTDIHSHIIFNVDDGSKSIEESLALLKKMKEAGFDNIITTPHYIANSEYNANNDLKLTKLKSIKRAISKQKLDINIYLGNEIYINNHMLDDLKKGNAYSLNNSKYLLFEIPFHNQILNLSDIIHELKIAGYIPILAHPERYDFFQDNPKLIDELKADGLLLQCNFASILGFYNRRSKKLMKYLLKKRYVDYLGTDVHRINNTYTLDHMDKILKKISKITGPEYLTEILKNADDILKEESMNSL